MKPIGFIAIFFIVSCNTQKSTDSEKKIMKVDSLKIALQGQWGGLGENMPVFEIVEDSIYYYDEKKTYSFQIVDKNLIIHRTEYKGVLKNISIDKDTMTFYDEQGFSVKGYRFKK